MPIFQYKAFDAKGNAKSGHLEASSVQSARTRLKQQGLFIKDLRQDSGKRDRQLFPFLSKIIYRIPRKEIGLLARQLGTLLGAGIKLDRALQDIAEQTPRVHLQKIITEIRASVLEGKTLSEALALNKDVFPPVYESMVKVGESTGSYEKTLLSLADIEEKNSDLKQKAFVSMIYPGFMLALMVFVVFFLLTSVIPQIEGLFLSFGSRMELPMPTKIVIALSVAARKSWLFLIVGFLVFMYGLHRYRKTEAGRYKYDTFILKVPIFGKLIKKLQVSMFCRNMSALLAAKVPILSAMQIVEDSVSNAVFKRELNIAARSIQEGELLKVALMSSDFLPHMVKGMISAGESSDRLAELIKKASEMMETEVETAVKSLQSSIEPIMIIMIGLIVGGIMGAILMPLSKLTDLIQ